MPSPKTNATAALEKLTPQRRKFVLAYCDTLNATKAALAAGYSPKTARTQGSQLLTILDIKAAVKAVLETASMDPEEIAARWTALARAGLDDFYTKVEHRVPTMLDAPLVNLIAEIEQKIAQDYEYTERSIPILGYDGERLAEYWDLYKKRERDRRLEILKHQMELERNPQATYQVPGGPDEISYRMQLDLVKAAELGLLDMVKTIAPTEFGLKVELRSPDAALDNLAKWQGMLTTKIDLTTKGQALAPPPIVGELSAEQARGILEARRRAREKGAASE